MQFIVLNKNRVLKQLSNNSNNITLVARILYERISNNIIDYFEQFIVLNKNRVLKQL